MKTEKPLALFQSSQGSFIDDLPANPETDGKDQRVIASPFPPCPNRPLRTGPFSKHDSSVEQFLRNVAAVFGKLLQNGLVQPHVHLRRIAHLPGRAAELDSQLLAGGEAAFQTQEFE